MEFRTRCIERDNELRRSIELMEYYDSENPIQYEEISMIDTEKLLTVDNIKEETSLEFYEENHSVEEEEDPGEDNTFLIENLDEEYLPNTKLISNLPAVNRTCNICDNDTVFLTLKDLNTHRNQFHLECPVCLKTFSSYQIMFRHKHRCHSEYPCNICDKIMKNKDSLRQHIKDIHEKTANHECQICNTKWKSLCKLNAHLSSTHKAFTAIKCNFKNCEELFQNYNTRAKHIVDTHTGVTKFFPCNYKNCKESFQTFYLRKVHRASHTGDSTHQTIKKCNYKNCKQIFRTKYLLRIHKASHFGVVHRKPKHYQSSDETFKINYLRKLFEITDTVDDVPNKCDFKNCKKTFKNNFIRKLLEVKEQPVADISTSQQLKQKKSPKKSCEEILKINYLPTVADATTPHQQPKLINSENCKKSVKTKSLRKKKNRTTRHTAARKSIPCTFKNCEEYFESYYLRNLHRANSHNYVQPQKQCDFKDCKEFFKTGYLRKLHKATHHNSTTAAEPADADQNPT